MSSPQLQTALWVLQPIIMAVLATVMFRRQQRKEFPVFFAFAIVQMASFVIEYPVFKMASDRTYFCTFWAFTALELAIQFKIIHEVFIDVFRPYHALKDLGTALFKWAAVVMVLVSGVFITTTSTWVDPVGRNVLILQRCVEVIQCGMVLFLLAFCKPLGISWRRQSFGIALGFGLSAGSDLICYGLFFGGHILNDALNITTMICCNLGGIIWILYSTFNRREFAATVLVPQRWDSALMDLQQTHNEPESLIPMFEHMVDRAFSKTQDEHA
jgi:uncharacterized protein with PQ loop repeat